jgi:hypothetical protein
LTLLQNGISHAISRFDGFLRLPDFTHDVCPTARPGRGQRLNQSNCPAIAGDDQRFALFKLIQNRLGFLVQLFCRDRAHGEKVTPKKCHRKMKNKTGPQSGNSMELGLAKAATNFDGELYSESLDSLYNFFKESRGIMRRFPVGRIKDFRQEHLGVLIHRILANVMRPFLEKWNGQYRAWYAKAPMVTSLPYEVQICFPKHKDFLADWTALRLIMRQVERKLAEQYKLVPLE